MTNPKSVAESTYCVACLMILADQLLIDASCPAGCCPPRFRAARRLSFTAAERYPLPVPICSACARLGFHCDHCGLAPIPLALESLMVAP